MALLLITLGKDDWNHVNSLIHTKTFDNIFLLTDKYGKENYVMPEINSVNMTLLVMDFDKNITSLITELTSGLKDIFKENRIQDLDIALNISSGTGIMHGVAISAITKSGYGVRLIDIEHGKIVEL